jgi:NitT/TauT family transport system permease protein
MRSGEKALWGALGVAAVVLIWQAAVTATAAKVFPSPLEVVGGLRELAGKGILWSYIGDSLRRVATGYLLAVLTGLPLGILIGWTPWLGRALNPLIQMMRPISPLAWMPLAVIWFGVSETAPIFLIFLGAFFPVVVAATTAVRNVSPVYRLAGRNFGLSSSAMLLRVIFPAILPRVLTGLRLALGIAWIVVVAAEMIAVDSGLGYLIIDSRNAGKRYDLVVAGMLVIGSIGFLLDILMRRLERLRSVEWGFN